MRSTECRSGGYCADRFRSREKRLQNLSYLATMAQQCAVAGHIADMVQERSNAAATDAAVDHHEDCQAEDRQAAASEHPVRVYEAGSPRLKSIQTPTASNTRCAQVPVDLSCLAIVYGASTRR